MSDPFQMFSSTDGPKSMHFDICSKNFCSKMHLSNILKRLFIYSINKGVQTLEKHVHMHFIFNMREIDMHA